jgi:hypothetical protein
LSDFDPTSQPDSNLLNSFPVRDNQALGAAPGSVASRERRPMSPAAWGWLVALVAWTALLSFYHLDDGAGLEPVEAWVTQPAREMYENISKMLANRDEAGWQWRPFVIPQFCGETRMQKSPGAYWAVCLTGYLRGTGRTRSPRS